MPSHRKEPAQEKIEAMRLLLKPSPVKPGTMPMWLQKRLTAAFGKQRPGVKPLPFAYDISRKGMESRGWLDHYGTIADGEDSVFVSEPYHLEPEDLQHLHQFCEKLGVKYRLDPNSWHYPGRTFRIVIYEA